MTGKLNELIRVLKNIDNLTQKSEETEKDFVLQISGWKDEFYVRKIIDLASKTNLINVDNKRIKLKPDGKILLENMTRDGEKIFSDVNPEQIKFLKERFLDGEQFAEEFREMLKKFWSVEKLSILTCKLELNHSFDEFILTYLEEIGIFEIRKNGDMTEIIIKDNLESISKIRHKIKGMSEDELIEKLEQLRDTGKKAEEYTIDYEKKRLKSEEKRLDLALDIKQISLTDVHAGFDIKSYDNGKSELTKHDRKIEVKGTTNRSPRFYWSSNEVNKAKEYGEKYWIYLWTNVGTENKEIQKIQDPYKKYFVDTIEKPKCTGYFIDKI